MSFIKKLFSPPKMEVPALPPMPEPTPIPEPEVTTEEEKKKLRRGAKAGQTILTSPLGLEEGKTRRKTLMGE